MCDRNFKNLSRCGSLRKWRGVVVDANVNVATNISQTDIAHHRARKKTRFQKNLEAITNPKDETTALRKIFHRLHHRGKSRKRAGAKIITMSKTARQNDRIAIR